MCEIAYRDKIKETVFQGRIAHREWGITDRGYLIPKHTALHDPSCWRGIFAKANRGPVMIDAAGNYKKRIDYGLHFRSYVYDPYSWLRGTCALYGKGFIVTSEHWYNGRYVPVYTYIAPEARIIAIKMSGLLKTTAKGQRCIAHYGRLVEIK